MSEARSLSFAEFDDLTERLGAGLLLAGLRPSERVLFQMGTCIATAVCLFACFKAGLIPVCSIPQFRRREMEQLIDATGAAAHFVQTDASRSADLAAFSRELARDHPQLRLTLAGQGDLAGSESMEALIAGVTSSQARQVLLDVDIDPEDLMKFQLSGGSTGAPKIIPRFHGEYLQHSLDWAKQFGKSKDSVCLWSLPLIHNGGQIWALFPTFLLGCKLVLCENDIDAVFDAIHRHGITHGLSIGPIAPQILAHKNIPKDKLKSLRIFGCMNRAGALEDALGVPCANVYGITEGFVAVAPPSSDPHWRHETNGMPASPHNELSVLQPDSEEPVESGGVGELCFRGPSSLVGYFNDQAASAAAYTSTGLFRTGDLVRTEQRGQQDWIVFMGRAKDNIDRGGEKFGVEDIEVLLGTHPSIADGKVVAMPDPVMGERACAFLVMRPGHSTPGVEELGEFLRSSGLARFKWPERIEVINAMPTTGVGKLDRNRLRQLARDLVQQEKMAAD
ncbi:AMP-binding protein [Mesorhizobium sp. IRAMC:0171]|uniref:AMP-binding protein n=1 Tax=Mesorhizobium retamae TaxID=2912854 RepID=A0ABS9QDA6_9HYPH|nr:AMP-binding protein [Mesorhizobium sp. IRAMC:0171]